MDLRGIKRTEDPESNDPTCSKTPRKKRKRSRSNKEQPKQEEAQMAKNTKTPLMVLTELTIKRGFPAPEFNLIYSKSNTHDNEFTYQVTIEGVCAVGLGKSKKEAKQNTAHRALELLNEKGIFHPDYSTQMDTAQRAQEMPSPKKPPVNCIGTLADLCLENKLPDPDYVEISDVGPPHCREFTYDCHLGSITTRATAGTKKQARQLAAKEMLDRTKDIITQIAQEYDNSLKELNDTDAEAICKFEELSNFNVKPNLTVKVRDYCETLINIMKEKLVDPTVLYKYFEEEPSCQALEMLLAELELMFKIELIQEEPFPYIVCLNINIDTPLTSMGSGENLKEAIDKAVHQMFLMIRDLLKYASA